MDQPALDLFLGGMVTAGFLAGGLFFARFWVRSRDSLFLTFSAAFWLLALNQALVSLVNQPESNEVWLYLLRVAAFVLIAVAIVRKNAGDASDE
jgi:peptidoglycan/LPS O-acetylase OafA/YrhL